MKILIIGSGGIGGFLGSRIQLSKKVSKLGMVFRSNYEAVVANGITVKSNVLDSITFRPTVTYNASKPEKSDDWDHVIVSLKTTQNAVDVLREYISKNSAKTMIHLVQNGVGIEEKVKLAFPENPLSTVSAFIRVHQEGMGEIVHNGPKLFTFGLHKSLNDNGKVALKEFANILQEVNVDTKISDNIDWVRWHKLAWNASFNTLSVLTGGHGPKALLSNPHTKDLVTEIHREVFKVATKLYGPRPPDLDDYKEFVQRTWDIMQANGEYEPSMLLDYKNKRPLELEAICVNPIRIAKSIGLEMPKLESVYQLLEFKLSV